MGQNANTQSVSKHLESSQQTILLHKYWAIKNKVILCEKTADYIVSILQLRIPFYFTKR